VVKCPDVSEEHAASIFRVTEFFWLVQLSMQPNQLSHPEDVSSTFFRNVGTDNHYTAQKS